MTSNPQASFITGILVVFTAVFLQESLKLFLTGGDQAFNNVKGGKPNAAVRRKRDLCKKFRNDDNGVGTKDKNQLNCAASVSGIS